MSEEKLAVRFWPPRRAPLNILVVDDDHALCLMLSRFLEKHGYTVYSASDALQALDILDRQRVGMVITDYAMPHMDGLRFTEMIKSDPRTQGIPVLMMTADPNVTRTDAGLRKGVAMTLPKPLDLEGLLTLVRFSE